MHQEHRYGNAIITNISSVTRMPPIKSVNTSLIIPCLGQWINYIPIVHHNGKGDRGSRFSNRRAIAEREPITDRRSHHLSIIYYQIIFNKFDAVILRSQVNKAIFSPRFLKIIAVATIRRSCISVIAEEFILCSITVRSSG